jgi:hypothetical protein
MADVRIRGAVRRRGWVALVLAAALALGLATTWRRGGEARAQTAVPAAPAALPGLPLGADHAVGAATVVDNLTVFPIYAKQPEDLGDFTTLEAALEKKVAIVREAGGPSPAPRVTSGAGDHAPREQEIAGEGARVDTVVVENRGKLPILVLAGTIVKGGNQDRQIGEDFVVGPGKTVDVAAFCVERGRWDGERDGKATGGRFVAQKSLALGSVRAAGQYDKDQGQVWSEVARVNAATKKAAPSGTLLATMDDAAIARRRGEMAARLATAVGGAERQEKLVGVAYAVDGEVKGVRWFAGPKLFRLHRETLLHTAAMEAIAVAAARPAGGPAPPPARPEAVAAFVSAMEREAVDERRAKADDAVAVKKGAAGYAAETIVFVDDPAGPGRTPAKKPKTLSKDFVRK